MDALKLPVANAVAINEPFAERELEQFADSLGHGRPERPNSHVHIVSVRFRIDVAFRVYVIGAGDAVVVPNTDHLLKRLFDGRGFRFFALSVYFGQRNSDAEHLIDCLGFSILYTKRVAKCNCVTNGITIYVDLAISYC